MRFDETEHGPEYRQEQESEFEKFHEYGKYYTEIQRDGKAVLHVMTDYYIDAIFHCARAEKLEPPPRDDVYKSLIISIGNLHIAMIHLSLHGSTVIADIIRNHIKSLAKPDDDQPSLTLSTQPVIEPEIANKGVENAKRNGEI